MNFSVQEKADDRLLGEAAVKFQWLCKGKHGDFGCVCNIPHTTGQFINSVFPIFESNGYLKINVYYLS